jgi:hypothetical protein
VDPEGKMAECPEEDADPDRIFAFSQEEIRQLAGMSEYYGGPQASPYHAAYKAYQFMGYDPGTASAIAQYVQEYSGGKDKYLHVSTFLDPEVQHEIGVRAAYAQGLDSVVNNMWWELPYFMTVGNPALQISGAGQMGTWAVDGFMAASRWGRVSFGLGRSTTAWANRFPGVQVRQVAGTWLKRVNPEANILMKSWGRMTIQQQANALVKLRSAGSNAARSGFLPRSGYLAVENVGTPLGLNHYLKLQYWIARAKDSVRMRNPINDLRPGNYGAGYRAFDPSLDPIQASIGAAALVGGVYGVNKLGDWLFGELMQ